MREIDDLLDGLGSISADPRLETMDAAVLAGIATRREQRAARKGLALTTAFALGVGLVGSIASPQGALAEQGGLNAVPPSAPSSLLMGQ